MKKAIFSSVDGRQSHRAAILNELRLTAEVAQSCDVELQIMCFAFTDLQIAHAISDLARTSPAIRINIIADWSQGAPNSPSVVHELAARSPDQINLRFKLDLPYVFDADTGRAKWNYVASHGMLHHKTLCVLVDGKPTRLLIGSYNWSSRGAQAYENSMVISASPANDALVESFVQEFNGLWNDNAATAATRDVTKIAQAAKDVLRDGGDMHTIGDLESILGDRISDPIVARDNWLENGAIVPAFSGRYLTQRKSHYGFGAKNSARKINLLRPSGKRKLAPVTLNTVALEAIRAVKDGDPLLVAMYAISPRVPEYAAILDAARRGCQVRILLDGKIGNHLAQRMGEFTSQHGLAIQIRTTNRRMHQKYLIAPGQDTIVTGTANMTEDSADRHAEHRILFRNEPTLCGQFTQDFETIWARLDRNYEPLRKIN